MRRELTALLGILMAGALTAGVVATPAIAAEQPAGFARFEKAQAKRKFVVYAPTTTLELPLSSFTSYACGNPAGPSLSAAFGSQSTRTSTYIGLQESPGTSPCTDGPDGVGPAATFTYEGAKVQVYGECAGGRATCDRSTPAGVKRQAYTTVTLPGSAVRPTQTYVEVYSQQVTLAQLREFIRGLVPAT
jgi:hypothetical protein